MPADPPSPLTHTGTYSAFSYFCCRVGLYLVPKTNLRENGREKIEENKK